MKKTLLMVAVFATSFITNINAQTALDLDGLSDYVDLGSGITVTSYTKEVWINWNGTSLKNNVLSGNGAKNHILWFPDDKGYKMSAGHDSANAFETVQDPTAVTANVWVHYAITYDVGTQEMILYRDGVQVDSGTDPVGSFTSNVFTIGAFSGNFFFGGLIDDVRIWDIVRTPAEIAASYNKCLSGSEANLVALYNLEDGTGSATATDGTGNSNTGTLLNMDPATDWVAGQSVAVPVAITSSESSPTGANPIAVTLTFDSEVTGFDLTDLVVGNGNAGNLAGSGSTYTFDVTPVTTGAVTVDLPASMADDSCGNMNEAANQFSIMYDMTLGVDNNILSNNLQIYPNPSNGTLNIAVNASFGLESLEIYDVMGKKVYSVKLNKESVVNSLNISSLKSGLYIVQIKSEDATVNRRIVKY